MKLSVLFLLVLLKTVTTDKIHYVQTNNTTIPDALLSVMSKSLITKMKRKNARSYDFWR